MADLEKEFCHALKGRRIWQEIKGRHGGANMFGLVMFPSEDSVVNSEAVALLPRYKERMFLQKVVAVTSQGGVIHALETAGYEDICCESLSHKEMKQLLTYYRLVPFCVYTAVVSLEEPFGNASLLYNGGMDLRSYILLSIYKVR